MAPEERPVAVVTGAAGGIGAAIAERVLAAGWGAVLVDRVAGSDVPPETATWLVGDVRSAADADRAVAAARKLGALRGLVNAAGIREYRAFADVDEDLLNAHLAVNLVGPALWMRAVVPAMADVGGGAIVNLTSVMAHAAVPKNAAYCASKAGLLGLSRAAALDLAPLGIRVNCLAPGPTDTPMLAAGAAVPPDVVDRIPLGRLGRPDDIADAVLFLLGPQSRFVTGGTLNVDGGFLAR